MALVPCPGIGQLTLSPTSATGFPFTIMVEDAEITAPPCVVLWPSNTKPGNDSNLLIVFYVQIMPDDFVMQLHR
ncbi:hypothetical protein SJ475_15255, partial [Klebsiella pneumoniae]